MSLSTKKYLMLSKISAKGTSHQASILHQMPSAVLEALSMSRLRGVVDLEAELALPSK